MTAFVPDVEDSQQQLQRAVAAQLQQPDAGLPRYFYRSTVTYQQELDNIFFRSWLYAGHVSQIPAPGDYFLYRIAEEELIVVRGEEFHVVEAKKVETLVDATGAGDLYAAGFLFGLTHGRSLAECGRLGSLAAAEIISHLGARPQTSLKLLAEKEGLL